MGASDSGGDPSGLKQLQEKLESYRLRDRLYLQSFATPGGLLWSLTEETNEEDQTTPAMDWSLGVLGDLLWILLPESRPHICATVTTRFQEAMEQDREVYRLTDYNLIYDSFYEPVLRPALEESPDPACVRRCCAALRALLSVDSPEGSSIREAVGSYIAENIIRTDREPALAAVDSELVEILRAMDNPFS